MREYKIFKTDLGFGIYRKKYVGKFIMLQYLTSNDTWATRKESARTFYNRDDAVSALVVMKKKDAKESD